MLQSIRTYCLELLSNIEELQAQTQDKRVSSLCASLISETIYFAREWVFKNQATFQHYRTLLQGFIDSIGKQNELPIEQLTKLKNIIDKQFNLVSQKEAQIKAIEAGNIPNKLKSRGWRMIQGLFRSGLLVKNIEAISKVAAEKGLPFKGFPVLPKEERVVNLYPTIDFVNRLELQYREAGRWLVNHLNVLTVKELTASIKEACVSLQSTIEKYDGYHLLTVDKKSQEWVANIAMRFLPIKHLPESFESIGNDYGGGNMTKDLLRVIKTSKFKKYLMFDDVSYTGTQLIKLLDALLVELTKKNIDDKEFNPYILLTIVFGFMSNNAMKAIQHYLASQCLNFMKHGVYIEIVCKQYFDNINAIVENEVLGPDFKEKLAAVCTGWAPGSSDSLEKSAVVTEWKRPDWVSTPSALTEGLTSLHRFRTKEFGYPLDTLDTEKEFEKTEGFSKPFDDKPPITMIVPPYCRRK